MVECLRKGVKIMDTVNINWDKKYFNFGNMDKSVKQSTNSTLDNKGFYFIWSGIHDTNEKKYKSVKLHYIGMTYKQTLRERIPQEHQAYIDIDEYLKKNPSRRCFVQVGTISEVSLDRQSESLYQDIENALIYFNKPMNNTLEMDNYDGREIRIVSEGDYKPLKQIIVHPD